MKNDIGVEVIDLFCGGGGVTTGAMSVEGVKVIAALNHSDLAIKIHKKNHPETKHFKEDIRKQSAKELPTCDILWASIECTNFSDAKGGGPKNEDSRTLAWELEKFIVHSKPKCIIIENVREFMRWGKLDKNGKPLSRDKGSEYLKWVRSVKELGYPNFEYHLLNSADYGDYTRRIRYFAVFTVKGYMYKWPSPTHTKNTDNLLGLPKWKPCRDKINLDNHGYTIFSRKDNPTLPKRLRRNISENTFRRIAGGIKKQCPEAEKFIAQYIMQYYNGNNSSAINDPLPVITTKTRHQLITVSEKFQFIMKYFSGDFHHSSSLKDPLHTITTVDHNRIITFEKKDTQVIVDHCRGGQSQSLDKPLNTQMTWQAKALATQFCSDSTFANTKKGSSLNDTIPTITTQQRHSLISASYNSNGKPEANTYSLEDPLTSITSTAKHQFISSYFSTGINAQSIEHPLGSILPVAKQSLMTLLDGFDIKMRHLNKDELGAITGFPDDYFAGLSDKDATHLIGNAVPVKIVSALIGSAKRMIQEK